MNDSDWDTLPFGHFKPSESWGNTQLIDFHLIWLLDCTRDYLRTPFYIVSGTQGVHKSDLHSRGLAIDICLEAHNKSILDIFFKICRFPFSGIGLMPFALHPKCKRALGIHFDIKPMGNSPLGMMQRHWLWIPKRNTTGEDIALSMVNCRKHNII